MTYDLAIFDFDGTLADSFPFFVGVHNQLAQQHGFARIAPADVDGLRHCSARELMRRVGLPRWKLPRVARSFMRLMHARRDEIALFDGIAATLLHLHERGLALAVVTSNSAANLRHVLGADLVARLQHVESGASIFGKRRRIARVLRATGVAPSRAIYVGDQLTDAEAAHAAGVAFGAVAWGYAAVEALAATDPEMLFRHVPDLHRLVAVHAEESE